MLYLREDGKDIREIAREIRDPVFILGDHTGVTEEEENQLLEAGARIISVGPISLHSNHCITLIHNELDRLKPKEEKFREDPVPGQKTEIQFLRLTFIQKVISYFPVSRIKLRECEIKWMYSKFQKKILHEGPICDNCLGRQFAKLSTGLSNRERGQAVKLALVLEGDRIYKSENDDSLLRELAPCSALARKTLRIEGEDEQCWVCLDQFKKTGLLGRGSCKSSGRS